MHEHFDVDGNPCRAADAHMTVVTREPEWDDISREKALRLHEYEVGICTCGCGQPIAQAHDSEQVYKVHRFTCQAGRAMEKIRRKDAADAKADAARRGVELRDDWNAGHHYYVEPVDPEEVNDGG